MKTGMIRLVHWDAGVRRRWRDALHHLSDEVRESVTSLGATPALPEVLVVGDPGGGMGAALALIKERRPLRSPVVMVISSHDAGGDLVSDALRLGVSACLNEPVSAGALAAAVGRCIDQNRSPVDCDALIGESEQIRRVRDQIRLAARVDSTVLIVGESGTGKELAARTLHEASKRSGDLVTLNCAAIPDSLLESELFGYERGAFTGAYRREEGKLAHADHGTLFLDEIGELSPAGQAKLLRVIEIKEIQRLGARKPTKVDVRVVAATNRNLEELVAERRFREDLYYRLNVVQIHFVPLRERIGDMPMLISRCLSELNERFHQNVTAMDDGVEVTLSKYRWPGNIRELRNLLKATCVGLSEGIIRFEHLPEQYQRRMTQLTEAPGATSERHRLLAALNQTRWNKSKAAEQLRWSRVTLYRKLAKYGIVDPSPATGEAAVSP